MVRPPVSQSATPRQIFIAASVTTSDGIENFEISHPFRKPIPAPSARANGIPSTAPNGERTARGADNTAVKARTAAQDRSYSPAIIIKVIPIAAIAVLVICSRRFPRFTGVRKYSLMKERISAITSGGSTRQE